MATAPIHVLIGRPLSSLTPEELRVVNQRLRQLRSSPPMLVKAVREESGSRTTKSSAKSSANKPENVDVKATASKYL